MLKQTFKTPLNFQNVPAGSLEDKVLMRTADGDIKELPSDSFGDGGTGTIEVKGIFESNGAALSGGLSIGDIYEKPIDNNGQNAVLSIVKDLPASKIRLYFEDIDQVASDYGIQDKNSVDDWNDYFVENIGDNFTFDTVTVTENIAEFSVFDSYKQAFSDMYFYGLGLVNVEFEGDFLNIERLNLSGNKIANLSPLMINVKELDLSENLIENFDVELPYVKKLNLSYNKISNFEPSNNNTYEDLNLSFNALTGCPKNLSYFVKYLSLTNNQIGTEGFDPIVALPESLRTLDLTGNGLTVFDPSIELPIGLEELTLNSNLLNSNFDPSKALPAGLRTLNLASNSLNNFNPSIPLPAGLKTLNLQSNSTIFFNPSTHPLPAGLKYFDLGGNLIIDFDPIAQPLPVGLESLNLSSNRIAVFNPSVALPAGLKDLSLNNNPQLAVFDPTIALPAGLSSLQLSGSKITDLNPTTPLPESLKYIFLPSSYTEKFNPTNSFLPNLEQVVLQQCRVTTANWNSETDWINNLTKKGSLYCASNIGSVTGTATETLLEAKGWYVFG